MDNKFYFESDVACENERGGRHGKMENTFSESGINITKTTFDPETPNGLLPRDAYYGIHCGPIWELDEEKAVASSLICADKISQILRPLPRRTGGFSVLVAGIGNRNSTPDTLGPLCADKIMPRKENDGFLPAVYVISPGVSGQTGIVTSDYVRAVSHALSPDVIIAVDSLAARNSERLGAFIQIGNCGITPGAGIDKRGNGINYSTMGIPVVSIGIPTVISTAVLVDTKKERSASEQAELYSRLSVTPKDCNAVTEIGATIISRALNACLSTGFGF